MSLVMSPAPSTRHRLLTPAASLARTTPQKRHGPPATLPISVPIRKSSHAPSSSNARRNRDPSPDMLFEMSPSEDAPIHYNTFAVPAAPSPVPSLPISTKNRLSLVDASLATSRTAPIPVGSHKPEPFLYAFPVLSPAAKSAPQSLPSRARARGSDLKAQPHPPSPPFGRVSGTSGRSPVARTTTRASGAGVPTYVHTSFGDSDSDHSLSDSPNAGLVATHWPTARTGEVHAVLEHGGSYRGDMRQYELERGRARAPKHRGH